MFGVHDRLWLSVKGCCVLASLKDCRASWAACRAWRSGTSGQGRAAYALTMLLLGQGRCRTARQVQGRHLRCCSPSQITFGRRSCSPANAALYERRKGLLQRPKLLISSSGFERPLREGVLSDTHTWNIQTSCAHSAICQRVRKAFTRSSVKLPKSQAPMGVPRGPSGGFLLKR